MAFFQSGDKEIVVDDDTVEPYESPLAHQKSYDDFSAVQEPKARQGRVYRLQPAVKQYAWGIRGGDSRVARYGLETGALKVIDQSAPYAEIWLGTHPSGPSLLDDGTELSKVVKGGNLPWLLKVLSAGKALSIQAHPDKSLAEKLHKDKPDLYKDSNHKPEMAIALTPFEAMCETRVLQFVVSRGVRVYLSEIVSEFGPKPLISTQVRLPPAVGDRGAPPEAPRICRLY